MLALARAMLCRVTELPRLGYRVTKATAVKEVMHWCFRAP